MGKLSEDCEGDTMTGKILFFDIESHNAGRQYGMTPQEFFRLGQYARDDGPVVLTTDYDEMIAQIRAARFVVGHNIHGFDLSVLFGTDSIEPLVMAQERKVIDTLTLATLLTPAPATYINDNGRQVVVDSPGAAQKYFGLENLSVQFKLAGKMGNLQDLAKKHNPPKTKVKKLDYGLIPLDDPDFLAYAEQDVIAVRDLYYRLVETQKKVRYDSEYLWREQELYAVMAQITRNGIRPNTELATARSAEQAAAVAETLEWLVETYNFPTQGKAPWKSNAGKEAILAALKGFGITPDHEEWEKTDSGAPSFGGKVMKAVTEGTEAEELGDKLAQLQGMRSMPDLVLESTTGDGRMHPDMTAFQKSGRFSVSRPSILIFNRAHKDLLLADEGCFTVELDFSNADARVVAAMSGDEEFAKRFAVDEHGEAIYDGHGLSGEVFFGYEVYHSTCEAPHGKHCRPVLRPAAKAAALSLGYNVGPRKLASLLNKDAKENKIDIKFWCSEETYWQYARKARDSGEVPMTEDEWLQSVARPDEIHTRELIKNYNESYPLVKRWKDRMVETGDVRKYVENDWGRKMPVDYAGRTEWGIKNPSRSYTQSPALQGQSTTRELMSDFLIKMCRRGERWARSLRGVIHDAAVVDLPKSTVEEDIKVVAGLMESTYVPKSRYGITIPFPVGIGPLDGENWKQGSH